MIEFSQRMNVIYGQFSAILAPIIMADESEKSAINFKLIAKQ